MTSLDEQTILILKDHRDELQALLNHLDDFFTEISITGLTSLACEEGYRKISAVQNECQLLGLNSTAFMLKNLNESLKELSNDKESRSKVTFLLNRMLNWQIVFRKQFDYLTAGTQILGDKDLEKMVETGKVEETYDLNLIPFAVDLQHETYSKSKVVISCLDLSLKKFYQFKDEITALEGYQSGSLKVRSQFFSGTSWDYGSALNKVISVEKVKLDTVKIKGKTILSSSGIKYQSIQKTITTGHAELNRESFEPVLQVLDSYGLVTELTEDQAMFTLNELRINKLNITIGTRSALWRLWRIITRNRTFMLASKGKKKTKQMSSLYLPHRKRVIFPAIEKFQTTSPRTEDLAGWIVPSENNTKEIIGESLLTPRKTNEYCGIIAEFCENSVEDKVRTSAGFSLLHKGLLLLNHQSTSLGKVLEEKIVDKAVKVLSKNPYSNNDDMLKYLHAGITLGDFVSREELSKLCKTKKGMIKSFKQSKKNRSNIDENYLFIASILHKKLQGKDVSSKDRKKLQHLRNTLVQSIIKTSKSKKMWDSLPKLAVIMHLYRHSLSVIIDIPEQEKLLEALYYIFKADNMANKIASARDEDLITLLSLIEMIYILRKRTLPRLF